MSAQREVRVRLARASQARRLSLHRRTLDLGHFEVRGALDRARARRPVTGA
jgi:hypothetical protein